MRCCILVRKGRFVAAEPYFEPGQFFSLAHAKRYHDDVGKLAIVAVTRSVGRVVEVLDTEENVHAVLRGLLAERGAFGASPLPGRGIDDPPLDVERQLAALPGDVPFMKSREDLRGQLCITIDPVGARDHDDAIGLEEVSSDGPVAFVLWVHIADVSAYVTPGSPLDTHALERALSVYVPGTVAPMLPSRLSSDLCSLRPGVDRGCVSVRLELSADAEVLGVRFARTVIRSGRRLSYEQVDEVLDGRGAVDVVIDELITRLDAVTAKVRERRMQRGALDMQLPEVVFELGERAPHSALLEPESPSHRLVEECMLLANEAVGSRLAQAGLPAIFRAHDEPDPSAVLHMVATFERLGVPTPPVSALEEMSGRDAARIAARQVRLVEQHARQVGRGRYAFAPRVLRALKQAAYRAQPAMHSGLAVTNYLHFTSPIRRYPDLVNHRSLLRMIGIAEEDAAAVGLDAVAEHVSSVEREAMGIERKANDIVLSHLVYDRLFKDGSGGLAIHDPHVDGLPGGRFQGEVTGLIASGMFVRFGDVFEGMVPARTLSVDERFELDEHGIAMVGTSSGERVQLGDPIEVTVANVDRARGKVELRRVGRHGEVHEGRARRREGARVDVDRGGGQGRRRKSAQPRGRRGRR